MLRNKMRLLSWSVRMTKHIITLIVTLIHNLSHHFISIIPTSCHRERWLLETLPTGLSMKPKYASYIYVDVSLTPA